MYIKSINKPETIIKTVAHTTTIKATDKNDITLFSKMLIKLIFFNVQDSELNIISTTHQFASYVDLESDLCLYNMEFI